MNNARSNTEPTYFRLSPSWAKSISFCPAPHPAEPFMYGGLMARDDESLPQAFLRAVAPSQSRLCHELLHTSLPLNIHDIIPRTNGFVDTVIEAYNRHRALIIRPDDVWLSILTQFAFFVNGNAETLRSVFVAHEGKQELEVKIIGNRYTLDPAWMAHRMTELMEGHLVDQGLRDWISPNFTTTTDVDKATCAIVMMGMMKEYFSYKVTAMCGIPKVTLEGEKKDWEEVLRRLERLKKYGMQTTAWYHLLRPIITRFVAAYDNPNSPENLEFWNKVVHQQSLGSGSRLLSGWITAFCLFDEKGRWQGNRFKEGHLQNPKETPDYLQMNASQFASACLVPSTKTSYLALDDFPYPTIDTSQIPSGYTYVNVEFDDNGQLLDTMLVAGSIGSQISSIPGETEMMRKGMRNTARPLCAWWYFVKVDVEEQPSLASTLSSPATPADPHHEESGSKQDRHRHSFFRLDSMFKRNSLFSSIRRK